MNNLNLVDLQLHKEEVDKGAEMYYLSAVYRHENDCGVYETTIPKIRLPISGDIIVKRPHGYRAYLSNETTIDIGFGDMVLLNDENGHSYYEKFIKEKIHDMTLDEIEKKLGYKVRVVSEKKGRL